MACSQAVMGRVLRGTCSSPIVLSTEATPRASAYYTDVTLSLLVVDPQPFFGEALAAALERRGGRVVGVTGDEVEGASIVEESGPDVLLTELHLAGGSGLSLIRRVADRTRCVVLTRGLEADALLDVVDAGASGCLSHDLGIDSLAAMLKRETSFLMDEARLKDVLKRMSALRRVGGEESRIARLSAREREVLSLLARGMGNAAIGETLYLSPHTVRTHVGNLLKKLEVHSRAEAARLLYRHERAHPDRHVLRISGPDLQRDD